MGSVASVRHTALRGRTDTTSRPIQGGQQATSFADLQFLTPPYLTLFFVIVQCFLVYCFTSEPRNVPEGKRPSRVNVCLENIPSLLGLHCNRFSNPTSPPHILHTSKLINSCLPLSLNIFIPNTGKKHFLLFPSMAPRQKRILKDKKISSQ